MHMMKYRKTVLSAELAEINKERKVIEPEDTSSGEEITTPFSPNDIKINTPPMNMGDLIDMLQYGWINIKTHYQRNANLWDEGQQSRLIESILLGLRLPAFYFEIVNKKHWNIIDGLQRCCAIKNFCVDNNLRLEGLEFLKQFEGKRFNDLQFETKRDIRMLPITVNTLQPGAPDQVKYILFKRLNTGGITLTNQEIRNAMYEGPAIDSISRMAADQAFINATEGKIKNLRHEDMDFVSRFAAFYWLGYMNYQPDLEHFINKAMADIRDNGSEEKIQKMESDFHKAMLLSLDRFGNRAFRKQTTREEKRKRINKAYFEVISSQLARLSTEKTNQLLSHKDLFVDNLLTAMRESKVYNDSFSDGTGSKIAVMCRFSWFNKIIDKSICGRKIRITNDNRIEDK